MEEKRVWNIVNKKKLKSHSHVKDYDIHQFTLVVQFWIKKRELGTSLVAQWLRICLPMQGTRVWALVREDPTCHGATKPVHNYWACALEPASCNYWRPHATTTEAHTPRAHAPQREAHALQRRVAPVRRN